MIYYGVLLFFPVQRRGRYNQTQELSFIRLLVEADGSFRLYSRDFAWTGVVERIARSSSSSLCHNARTDLPDPLSPPVSIVYRSWELFKAISCIGTEQLFIGSSWPSCLCSSMWRGPQEYIAYEFALTSPAVSHMSVALIIISAGSRLLFAFFLVWNHFLLFDPLVFVVQFNPQLAG